MATQLLQDKIVLVTGGGSGIGRATCQVAARDGAIVVATDINHSSAQGTVDMLSDPSKHLALMLDVTKSESVDAAISAIMKKYKAPPTLLVNSAGIVGYGAVRSLEESSFTNVLDVNLKGTFLTCKAVANAMQNHGSKSGSFVNISSVFGLMGMPLYSCYSASKGGIIAFTKATSKELIKDGIRINCVCPGPIETGMVQSDLEIVQKAIKEFTAIGRIGQPEEVAEVIGFLLSERSSFMVGSAVEVTGGFIC